MRQSILPNTLTDVVTYITEGNEERLPSGPVVKNLPARAGDTGLIPGLRGSHMPLGN